MRITCAWCLRLMGAKPPYHDNSISHSICIRCEAQKGVTAMPQPRPNTYDPNVELRHKLMKVALNPQPQPMNRAEQMAHDLATGDKIAKIALGIIASAAVAFVWVAL